MGIVSRRPRECRSTWAQSSDKGLLAETESLPGVEHVHILHLGELQSEHLERAPEVHDHIPLLSEHRSGSLAELGREAPLAPPWTHADCQTLLGLPKPKGHQPCIEGEDVAECGW